jgi:SAM-dependent methyltransferase
MSLSVEIPEVAHFFDDQAALLLSKPQISLRDLCYVSGRDYRVWPESVYEDLIASLVAMLDLGPHTDLLEVGCAAGFLARGLSPLVGAYHGVDVSSTSLKLAARLGLPNAQFRLADGAKLPFGNARFDRAICYDVFTNIAEIQVCRGIIAEMARVTKKGGRFLIGSLADANTQSGYEQRVREVSGSLPPVVEDRDMTARRWMPWRYRLLDRWHRLRHRGPSSIVCYYFQRDFFVETGRTLGLGVGILPMHPLNPYVGYRFNALFQK